MNVMINLLPDIRQTKQEEYRRRQMVTGVAVTIWAVCGGLLLLLGLYTASQKLIINNDTNQIRNKEAQLQDTTGLVDALTAQQHLSSLPMLFGNRVYLSKFFQAFVAANPQNVSLNSLTLDLNNALTINGTASSYALVSKLANALIADNVTIGAGAAKGNSPYFTNVAISSASKVNALVAFTITANVGANASAPTPTPKLSSSPTPATSGGKNGK